MFTICTQCYTIFDDLCITLCWWNIHLFCSLSRQSVARAVYSLHIPRILSQPAVCVGSLSQRYTHPSDVTYPAAFHAPEVLSPGRVLTSCTHVRSPGEYSNRWTLQRDILVLPPLGPRVRAVFWTVAPWAVATTIYRHITSSCSLSPASSLWRLMKL
jgi:hypothetical protein